MADTNHNRLLARITRYGVPLLVLVFYVSAVRGIRNTPDDAFVPLTAVADITSGAGLEGPATPAPPWTMMILAGGRLGLDPLLQSKVLGLLFSCLSLLLAYLVAIEVLRDRLVAFCASVAVAANVWLLESAASGNAVPLLIVLSLATIFFLLRNEYLLAAIMAALSALTAWEGSALIACVLADILLNSRDPRRGLNAGGAALLVAAVVLLPWVLFGRMFSFPLMPELPAPSDAAHGAATTVLLICLVVAAGIGLVRLFRLEGPWHLAARGHLAIAGWMIVLLLAGWFGNAYFLCVLAPLLTIYSFAAVPARQYTAVFGFTAFALLANQVVFGLEVAPAMAGRERQEQVLREAGYFLRASVPPGTRVSGERPKVLRYYSGLPVEPFSPDRIDSAAVVVTTLHTVPGFVLIQSLPADGDEPGFGIWRRP